MLSIGPQPLGLEIFLALQRLEWGASPGCAFSLDARYQIFQKGEAASIVRDRGGTSVVNLILVGDLLVV